MIKLTTVHQGRILDDLRDYADSFQESVNAATAEVVNEIAPDVLDELRYTPPERDHSQPIDWTSVVQGAAFHASGGFGGGIPHQRSGAMPDGWIVEVNNGVVTIANPLPGAEFVYGSLAKSNPGKFQQQFLKAIGWPTMYYTVVFWRDAIVEEVYTRIAQQFKGIGGVTSSSRAYTRHA